MGVGGGAGGGGPSPFVAMGEGGIEAGSDGGGMRQNILFMALFSFVGFFVSRSFSLSFKILPFFFVVGAVDGVLAW